MESDTEKVLTDEEVETLLEEILRQAGGGKE